jgi:cell division protein FtsX
VTAVVILGGMVGLSGATRSPVAPPSSPAPISVPGTQTQVSVFLNSAVTEEQKRAIESALRRLASVKEVRFESRQEAYARFKEQFKDAPDLIAATRPDSFPDSFRLTLKAPSGFCDVARLKNQPGVSQITGPAAYTASC